VTIGTGSGAPGSTGNPVPVYLTANEPIRGVQLDVADVPDELTASGCTSRVTDFTCTINEMGSVVSVIFVSLSGALIPAGTDVPIFDLLYDVDAGATPGTVSLQPQNLQVSDENNDPCPATGVPGSFEVLSECPVFPVALATGWTMVGPALEFDGSAEDLCDAITNDCGGPAEVDRWVNGGWEGHICGLPFNDFSILPGEGYFVRSECPSLWCQDGAVIASPLRIDLFLGWNSVSLPLWAVEGTAESVCQEIEVQGGDAVEIDRFVNGGWVGHICGLPFNDFPVVPGEGYFIRVAADSTWMVPRPVLVSNLTDWSFTVSLTTDAPQGCQVNYGTTPELGQTEVDDRGADTVDDTHHITLSGLRPETLYYFDVECDGVVDDNGGLHYTQETGPTLAIPASDTVFGRVFLEGGVTPATGAMVYVRLKDANGLGSAGRSTLLSDVVTEDDNGFWDANLGNARNQGLSAYFVFSSGGDVTLQRSDGVADGFDWQEVDTAFDGPSPAMVLRPLYSTSRSSVLRLEGRGPTWAALRAAALAKHDLQDSDPVTVLEGPYVANQTDTAFTVVWTTDRPVLGQVSVTGPDGVSRRFGDARGAGSVSRVHYVTVSGLVPETDYQVEIVEGPYLASPVEEGYWSVNLGNLRTRDLSAYLGSDPGVRLETRLLSGAAIPGEKAEQPEAIRFRDWNGDRPEGKLWRQ
jgi:hypothetical protein